MEPLGGTRQLRRECEARLDALGLRAPFDLSALVARVSEQRRRPLRLLPLSAEVEEAGECSGLWVATESVDYVFATHAQSTQHRKLVTCHELSHIIFNHEPDAEMTDAEVKALFPTLAPNRVHMALRRTNYKDVVEQEAEMLASVILARAADDTSVTPDPDLVVSPEATVVLSRLSRVLR